MSSLEGYQKLNKSLRDLSQKMANKVVRKGTAKMAQVVRKEMRKDAKKFKKSGKLNKELRYQVKKDRSGGFKAQVGAFNDAFYMSFLEFGTKPHRIPKKKGTKLSIKGRVVENVQHPGIKGQNTLSKAYKKAKDDALKQAGVVMFNEIKKLL